MESETKQHRPLGKQRLVWKSGGRLVHRRGASTKALSLCTEGGVRLQMLAQETVLFLLQWAAWSTALRSCRILKKIRAKIKSDQSLLCEGSGVKRSVSRELGWQIQSHLWNHFLQHYFISFTVWHVRPPYSPPFSSHIWVFYSSYQILYISIYFCSSSLSESTCPIVTPPLLHRRRRQTAIN